MTTLILAMLLSACSGGNEPAGQADMAFSPGPMYQGPTTTDVEPPAPISFDEFLLSLTYNGSVREPAVSTKDIPIQVANNANVVGAWSAVRSWPLIGIHAALLPDGRVMTYGTDAAGKQTGKFIYDVWDSSASRADLGHLTLPNTTNTDLFCSSQTLLPTTGELLINGGDIYVNGRTTNSPNNNTNVFNPVTNGLTRGAAMKRARWYSSVTTLPDATQYIQGGSGGADYPEHRSLAGNYRLLTGAPTSGFSSSYPHNFVARDGRIFGHDSAGRMYFVDTRGDGFIERLSNLAMVYDGWSSSSVMYAPDKVLRIGAESSAHAAVIDLSSAVPFVSATSPTSSQRILSTGTVLPNGHVLVTGGSTVWNQMVGVNNTAEIWNPTSGAWTLGPPGALARLYHSTALLLPDATVLVAGGGAPGPLVNTNAEIYYPPYLFGANGTMVARPTITSAPSVVNPGDQVDITVDDGASVGEVVLVRTGSVTHTFNFDQRRVPLFHRIDGNSVSLEFPDNGGVVPPGFYMLFVLNQDGVPSVASMLKVNIGDQTKVAAPWSGRIGGGGGTEFELQCLPTEVLVGVHGNQDNYVPRIGPKCVAVGPSGDWLGDPVNRSAVGGTNGSAFDRTCPQNYGVAGITGRSGGWLDQLTLSCRRLGSDRLLNGTATTLPAIGGSGGTLREYRNCGGDSAAYAVYGRVSSRIESVGILCHGKNLAVGRPASQSSESSGGSPGRAVDGNKSGVYALGSVTHTSNDTQSWWEVDLERVASIDQVRVWNRTDCCSNRLGDFTGFVSVAPMTGRGYAQLIADPLVAKVHFPGTALRSELLAFGHTPGRYVRIQMASGQNILSLAEVEVLGEPIINSDPTVSTPPNQSSIRGVAAQLQINAADADGNVLTYAASGLPTGLAIDTQSGLISGSPDTLGAQQVTVTVNDGLGGIASASFNWDVQEPAPDFDGDGIPDAIDPDDDNDGVPDVEDADPRDDTVGAIDLDAIVAQVTTQATLAGGLATLTVSLNSSLASATYLWDFGDGQSATSNAPQVSHNYAAAGRYSVAVDVRVGSLSSVRVATQVVHLPLTVRAPQSSSTIIHESPNVGAARLWIVNPDQNTVSVVGAQTNALISEIAVGSNPRSLASDQAGAIYVVNKTAATLSVIDTNSLEVIDTISLPRGADPHGIVVDDVARLAYVVLESRGTVVKFNLDTRSEVAQVNVGPNPRHLALTADGSALLVSRFITEPVAGESTRSVSNTSTSQVIRVDTADLSTNSIGLAHDIGPDTEASARGVPNYLMAPAVSPDGLVAVVPFKSDNVFRGVMRDAQARQHDRLIRAKLGRIDLTNAIEDVSGRIDFDNNSPPTAAAFDPTGNSIVVIHEGSRLVEFLDRFSGGTLGVAVAGMAPAGLVMSPDGSRTWVHNYLGRSLSVFDTSALMTGGALNLDALTSIDLTATEQLSAQVLEGKRLFHDALDSRLVSQNYLSCASCHSDGGHDGRVWDVSDAGEGLRNTIDLRGKAGNGHGNVHWTANFDEIHDFEIDIRQVFGGTGLLSDSQFATHADPLGSPKAGQSAALDALAAYVTSLATVGASPHRAPNGNLTASAQAGREVFIGANCASCHSGSTFTDSPLGLMHDVGTIDADSGQRLGQPLTGLDTPTLRGLWRTGPFLHDGAALTVEQAVLAHTSSAVGFDPATLTSEELGNLAAYVGQIDDAEAVAPVFEPDTDGDGIADSVDPDDDNDGVDDAQDAFPLDAAESLDTDGDGIGNNADADDDNDGVNDAQDAFPLDSAESLDTDGDGIGNNADADDDNDGVNDPLDAFPLDATESVDTDGDGIGNNADTDDDGDGVLDGDDLDPLDPNVGSGGGGDICNQFNDGGFESGIGSWFSNATPAVVGGARTGAGALNFGDGFLGQVFDAVAGTQYTFSGYYQSGGNAGWAGFGVDFVDLNGDEVGELVRTLEVAGDWTAFSLDAPIPAAAAFIRPWFYAQAGRTITLDDIDLRKTGCSDGNVGNQPPFVSNPGNQVGAIGDNVGLSISAIDPDGDTPTFSASNLPTGLSIGPNNGIISGSLTSDGASNVTVFANDGQNTGQTSFIWTVTDPSGGGNCNALNNGGFESGMGGWSSSVSPAVVTDAAVGNSAAQFSGGWISVTVPGAANTDYSFTGQYQSVDGNGWSGFGVDYLDSAGNEIGEEVRTLDTAGSYTPFALSATSPIDTVSVRIWFYADPDRQITLDVVDIRESGCTGNGGGNGNVCNAVTNSGFESNTGGWFTNTTPTLVADAAEGNQAVAISGGWMSHVISVQPGTTYSASALVKSSGDTGWSGSGLDFVDANGNKLADAVQTIDPSGTYGPLLLSGTAPAGATEVQFWFFADPTRTTNLDAVDFRVSGCD